MRRHVRDALRANAPFAARMHNAPEQKTIEGLPPWCDGAAYRAADDTIVLRVKQAGALTMTAEEAIALSGAILQLVDASARNREIIDVDADDAYDVEDRDDD